MKYLPRLCYGLEACPFIQSQLRSLEFAVSSAVRKYFPQSHITLSVIV